MTVGNDLTAIRSDRYLGPILHLDIDGEFNKSELLSLRANKTKLVGIGNQTFIVNYRNTILSNRSVDYNIPENWETTWSFTTGPIANPNQIAPCFLWLKPEKFIVNNEGTKYNSLLDSSRVGMFENYFAATSEDTKSNSDYYGFNGFIPLNFDGIDDIYIDEGSAGDFVIQNNDDFILGFVVGTEEINTNSVGVIYSVGRQNEEGSIQVSVDETLNSRTIKVQTQIGDVSYIVSTSNNCYTQGESIIIIVYRINETVGININGVDYTSNGSLIADVSPSNPITYIGGTEDVVDDTKKNFLKHDLYEVVLLKEAVSIPLFTETVNKLEGYFSAKYKIPLVSSHPYKDNPFRTSVFVDSSTLEPVTAIPLVSCTTLQTDVNSFSFAPEIGNGTVAVDVEENSCQWSAYTQNNWITLANNTGIGNGSFTFSITENEGEERVGIITVISGTAPPVFVQITHQAAVSGIVMTGGTVTDVDGFRYHTFTSSDSLVVSTGGSVEVLLVAGGGGGGSLFGGGGGGGAGGVRLLDGGSAITLTATTYTISVGGGGAGGTNTQGTSGSASSVVGGSVNESATGGGGGGGSVSLNGLNGGSGGGGSRFGAVGVGTSGEGNNGGAGDNTTGGRSGGGGGGAAAAGAAGTSGVGGNGGNGSTVWGTTYGGGGGGASEVVGTATGGSGGGGDGGQTPQDGAANTGGGGGGGRGTPSGAGGSGIVIVRYPQNAPISGGNGEESNELILNPVSIRLQSSSTQIVTLLPSAVSGNVLLCGGLNSTDLTPTGSNIETISYQWKRNGANIALATSQTYTLVEEDIDTVVSVEVTATSNSQSTSRKASVTIGEPQPNANSRMGTQGSPPLYYGGQVAFVNLAYSSFNKLDDVVRSTNSPSWNGGVPRFTTTDSAFLPHFTPDGWPKASSAGPISGSNYLTRAAGSLLLHDTTGAPRLRSILNLQEPWDAPSRPVRFNISTYWQGSGYAHANPGFGGGTQVPVTAVTFAGPDGVGPFGTGTDVAAEARGPISMSRTVYQHQRNTQDTSPISLSILDSSQSDPVRNIVVLVHDVETQDADGNWSLVYAGFDHTTYRPFQLYPAFIEANRHFRVWRFMNEAFVQGTNVIISQNTGVPFESMTWDNQVSTSSSVQQTVWNTGWSAFPTTLGVEYGFAAINRPTHALFGRSLRAAIEICNGLGADMWWCHPHTVAWAGSSGVLQTDGSHICKTNAETKTIQVDQEYIAGFASEITAHLRPNLALLNEWSNETWNEASSWVLQTLYASSMYRRLIASESEGGDGLPFTQTRARGAFTSWHGAISAWNVVAISAIGRALEAHIQDRDVVAIYGGQSAFFARNRDALGWVEYTMPGLFAELDAIAHAPYRTPPRGDFPTTHLDSWTESGSWWRVATSGNHPQGLNLPHFLRWKGLALDMNAVETPLGTLSGSQMRSYAPSSARRWNLKLFTYEGGQHDEPATADQQAITFAQQYDPRYFDFYSRYFETLFAPGPRGVLDAQGLPAGVELHDLGTNTGPEPIHDLFTHFKGIDRWGGKYYWGSKQFNGETESPKADAIQQIVIDQPWDLV